MKLNLSKVVQGCRLGTLNNLGKKGDHTMEFPGCLLYTRTGSAPHLTHDTLQLISRVPVMTQLTLSSLAEHYEVLEEYKEGIGKFIAIFSHLGAVFPKSQINSQSLQTLSRLTGMPESMFYCSLHDPVNPCPAGYVTNKSVSVWGVGGRLEMTAAKFMSIQQALQPDWFQCLSDGEALCSEVSSVKRARKSVDRSLTFLDECLKLQDQSEVLRNCVMIGVIEGGDILEERLRSAKETAKRPVGGFLLDGFHRDAMTKETRLQLMSSVTAELPEDKPRLICGVGQPDEVLECVEAGVDLFESFFPYQATERGCALSFSFVYQPNPEDAVLQQNGKKEEGGEIGDHINKVTTTKPIPETSFEINLKEKKYYDDFGPLVEGCSCYCCKNHSRAYVHHLLVTNELLAGVLLMMHNFQHYFGFFCAIREALRTDRLGQLKELICRQAS